MSTDLHQLHLWRNKTNHLNDFMEEKVICFSLSTGKKKTLQKRSKGGQKNQ